MRLEKIAVEIGNMRWRAAIQRAEVPDNGTPKRIFWRANSARTKGSGWFFAKLQRFLMRTTAFFLVKISPPRFDNGNKEDSRINVAVFADAEKQDSVEDVLDSFIEFVPFKQIFTVVVLKQVACKFTTGFVEQIKKLDIQRAGTVGFDEPLLAGFAFARRSFWQRFKQLVNAASGDFVAGEQIPNFLRDERKFPKVPRFPKANIRLIRVRFATDDVNFEFLKVSQDGQRKIFVPGVAFGLESVTRVKFLGGFLGFANKTVVSISSEKIIGALLSPANFRATLNFDFAFGLNQSGAVFQIPAERTEKRIEKIITKLRLHITGTFEFAQTATENADQTIQFLFKGFKAGGVRHGE